MRLLDIMESAGSEIPNFEAWVTDDLIDHMINTGYYVEHGAEIYDQWDADVFEFLAQEMHPEIVGKAYRKISHTPEFKNVFREAVKQTARQEYNALMQGDKYHGLPPFSPDTTLYRGLTTHGLDAKRGVGVFWSQDKTTSLHRFIKEGQIGLLLVAKARDVTVDWYETFRSRLDMSNGGEECEIQLQKGSHVKCRAYRVEKNKKIIDLGYIFRYA